MTGNCHVRCGVGENLEITSKGYLSLCFEMVATTMEKKRLGLIGKACVVVPKHLTMQMASEWIGCTQTRNCLSHIPKIFQKITVRNLSRGALLAITTR